MAKKEVKLDSKGYRKFGMRDKLAYAAGDFGCNMSFALKSTVQTFWLVYMMMETGLLSALLLLVQIWDAVNDPLIGNYIDNDKRKYKMGKFKTYIFIGACGLVIVCVLPFFFNGVFGASVDFGGTSLIIIVSVILETIKQIESMMLVRNYKGFLND